jgi:ABC-type polysaccharide/polyol phosphate export permease
MMTVIMINRFTNDIIKSIIKSFFYYSHLLKKLVFLTITVIGVHIAAVNTGTLVHVVNIFGIRWEVFNTSGKEIHTLHYLLFILGTTIIQTVPRTYQNYMHLHCNH